MQTKTPLETSGDQSGSTLKRCARWPRLRALAWSGERLYAARGYDLLSASISHPCDRTSWEPVGTFDPGWVRRLSATTRLSARLLRDGFHALARSPNGAVVAAVAGAIVRINPPEREFVVTHRIGRGTRPLHLTTTPDGRIYWGEYFDNPRRDEVHIYASEDAGKTWDIAYTFAKGAIRHVHNIVHDPWQNCLWVLTGDYGTECRILRASFDFSSVNPVLQGDQQARAVALVPMPDGLYFSSDTPLEQNYIYRLDRGGGVSRLAPICGSSIYGCQVKGRVFFSTMVEPSEVNRDRQVRIYGGSKAGWLPRLSWPKDHWSMRLFQYGNAFLPDGQNSTPYLAVSTIAVESDDMVTSLYRVDS